MELFLLCSKSNQQNDTICRHKNYINKVTVHMQSHDINLNFVNDVWITFISM